MANSVQVIECDIPEGMTCEEYKAHIAPPHKPNLVARIIKAVLR